MSIFDRLGDVLKSYLNDEDERVFGKSRNSSSRSDPDYHAAYEELNDYLNKDKPRSTWSDETPDFSDNKKTNKSWSNTSYADYMKEEFAKRQSERSSQRAQEQKQSQASAPNVPEVLRKDFDELGIEFGSVLAECKISYKKLLKKHHPDRHAGHERNMKKATEKSARINVSYRRIETWYETGKIE
ncbi:MAG: J domain-containing protein [Treponema sp.]|jgi:hypothetical protein|nr:J domain-containing protein [Treponema sp.]